jgi:hypothetical protein
VGRAVPLGVVGGAIRKGQITYTEESLERYQRLSSGDKHLIDALITCDKKQYGETGVLSFDTLDELIDALKSMSKPRPDEVGELFDNMIEMLELCSEIADKLVDTLKDRQTGNHELCKTSLHHSIAIAKMWRAHGVL